MATRKKAKRLRVQEVKSIAQAVRKDVGTDVDLKDKILESISKMKQLAVFPERQQLYSMLTSPDMRPAYEKLVSSLLEDYLKLFSSIKGQAKYLDFHDLNKVLIHLRYSRIDDLRCECYLIKKCELHVCIRPLVVKNILRVWGEML